MSEVKRYGTYGRLVEAIPQVTEVYPGMDLYVLASDYDALAVQFDALAEAVGFSQARCEQTGDSPLDCAQQLAAQRDEGLAREVKMLAALKAARDLWGDYLPPGNSNAMKAMRLVDDAIASPGCADGEKS